MLFLQITDSLTESIYISLSLKAEAPVQTLRLSSLTELGKTASAIKQQISSGIQKTNTNKNSLILAVHNLPLVKQFKRLKI